MMLALVTGASSGIGRATAIRLAADGYRVVVHYGSSEAAAADVAHEIEQAGGSAMLFRHDLADVAGIDGALDRLYETLGETPAAVVNNAGITADSPMALMDLADFDRVLKINLYAPFAICRWMLRNHSRRHKASVVNVGSISAQLGHVGQANYAASKAGLAALTVSVAKEGARKGLRANLVAVGLVETRMTADVPGLQAIIEHVPLQRMGAPDEIARAVAFLVSDAASYITGETLNINGGLYCP